MGAQAGWPRAAAPVGSCPSSAEPAPDLVLPVIALLRPDLSETHSLDLLTILQSPGCPGLGVQLTAMEHPSIQQTWTEPCWVQSTSLGTVSGPSSFHPWNSKSPEGRVRLELPSVSRARAPQRPPPTAPRAFLLPDILTFSSPFLCDGSRNFGLTMWNLLGS